MNIITTTMCGMRWQKVCILAIWFHNFSRSTSSCYWSWLYLFLLRRIREFEKLEGRPPYTVLSLLAQLRCLPILPSFSFLFQCLNNHPTLSLSFAKPLSSHSWITKSSKAMQHGREIGEIPKQDGKTRMTAQRLWLKTSRTAPKDFMVIWGRCRP